MGRRSLPLLVQNAIVEHATEYSIIKVGIEASQQSYFISDALNTPSASVAETVHLVEDLVRTV